MADRTDGNALLFVHLFDLRLSLGIRGFLPPLLRIDLNGLAVAALVVIALIALAKGILWLP